MESYTQDLPGLLEALGTREEGLAEMEARVRLMRQGPNLPGEGEPASLPALFRRECRRPAVLCILAAGMLLPALEGTKGIWAGLCVLALTAGSCLMGALWERYAQKVPEELSRRLPLRVTVRREGKERQMDASLLVRGDVMVLRAGDRIPADGRILTCRDLRTEERALLGGEFSGEKEAVPSLPEDTPPGGRRNMVYAGTAVVRGTCTAAVTAVGEDTLEGKLKADRERMPRRVTCRESRGAAVRRGAGMLCLISGAVILGAGLLRGGTLRELLPAVFALGGLAMDSLPGAYVLLAAGAARRMAGEKTVCRTLAAAEKLGELDTVFLDPVGTLCAGIPEVARVWSFTAPGRRPVLAVACLCLGQGEDCSREEQLRGKALEEAARREMDPAALKKEYPLIRKYPREGEVRFRTTVHLDREGKCRVAAAGEPEQLLFRCRRYLCRGERELDGKSREEILSRARALAEEGYEVLLAAEKRCAIPGAGEEGILMWDLTFLGLVAFRDPVLPQAKEGVERCLSGGLRPVLVTDKAPCAARRLGEELGLLSPEDEILTGGEAALLGGELLAGTVKRGTVFTRLDEKQRLRILRLRQSRGRSVALMGERWDILPPREKGDLSLGLGSGDGEATVAEGGLCALAAAAEQGRKLKCAGENALWLWGAVTVGGVLFLLLSSLIAGAQWLLLPGQTVFLGVLTGRFLIPALGESKAVRTTPGGRRGSAAVPGPGRVLCTGALMGICALTAAAVSATGAGAPASGAFGVLGYSAAAVMLTLSRGDRSVFSGGWKEEKRVLAGAGLAAGAHTAALLLSPGLELWQWGLVLLLSPLPCLAEEGFRWGKKHPLFRRGGARARKKRPRETRPRELSPALE